MQLFDESVVIVQEGDICVTDLDECPIVQISFENLDQYTAATHLGENDIDNFWNVDV